MATETKIVTLYQGIDSDTQQAIAPRTKTSAVSDENNVGLDVVLSELEDGLSNVNTALASHTHTPASIGAMPYVTVTETGTNLDDYMTSGFYFFSGSHTPTNIPFGSNGYLLVMRGNGQHTKQIFFRAGTADSNDFQFATRAKTSADGWGSWRRLAICEYNSSTNTLNFIM